MTKQSIKQSLEQALAEAETKLAAMSKSSYYYYEMQRTIQNIKSRLEAYQ